MNNKYNIQGEFPVQIIKENTGYSVVCYQLNLATQGDTIEEAKTMFQEALVMFIDDLIENNCLEQVMIESGFRIEMQHNSLPFKIIVPPETLNTTIKIPTIA